MQTPKFLHPLLACQLTLYTQNVVGVPILNQELQRMVYLGMSRGNFQQFLLHTRQLHSCFFYVLLIRRIFEKKSFQLTLGRQHLHKVFLHNIKHNIYIYYIRNTYFIKFRVHSITDNTHSATDILTVHQRRVKK